VTCAGTARECAWAVSRWRGSALRWVVAEAEVDGARRVRQAINGALVVEYTDLQLDPANDDARRLRGAGAGPALESGYISIQSNGHPVEFRRIDVLVLDAPPGG